MANSFERALSKKFKDINQKIKTSFALIRKDIDEMNNTLEAMREYLKKQEVKVRRKKKEDKKIQEEFRRDVDEFTQKTTQLRLSLSEIKSIKNEVVVVRDLAKIEDKIKISFKEEVEGYKELVKNQSKDIRELRGRVSALEKGYVKEKKKWFFGKGNSGDNIPKILFF